MAKTYYKWKVMMRLTGMRRAHLNTPRICAHQRSYFIPIDPTAQMKKYLVLVVLFAILFQFEVAQAQHYFVKYLGKNCSFENVNGVYIEHDFHRIPEQFQDLQNRLENDLIHMWTKHSGNNFRVWFQNSRGYTLYHDALDMKWHLVDPMWETVFLHKDVHHHDQGKQAGSHETELPPLDGYKCNPNYSKGCGDPPIFSKHLNHELPHEEL